MTVGLTPVFGSIQEKGGSAEGALQVFTNGTIYTDVDNVVTTLVVKDGIVLDAGNESKEYPGAKTIDLNGSFVYPGFHDSHVHLVEAGYGFSSGCFLYGATNAEAICAIVGPIAAALPAGQPMMGGGFSMVDYDAWSSADLAQLDSVTGNRPVFLGDQLGHNAIVNTATLKMCNITGQTQSPPGGIIILENGSPTGMLRESAMQLAGNILFNKFDDNVIESTSHRFFDTWASSGYTSINDLSGFSAGRMLKPEMLKKMEREGNLSLRVNYLYTIFSLDDIDDALQYIGNDTEKVRFLGLKIFVDGAYGGGQAWTSWENVQGNHGLHYVYTDDLNGTSYNISRIIEKADDLHLDVHYHVQGDEAIEAVLIPLEQIKEQKGALSSNHTLIHLAFPTDDQISRMKQLGDTIHMTVQPAFWSVEENLTRYYGNHINESYPLKKLYDSGISMGISTDFGVSPLELSPPTAIMGVATTGGGDPVIHVPLTVKELIQGLTTGSAATTPKYDVGRLDQGNKADFVVYNQDLTAIPDSEFSKNNPKVLATYINGIKEFDAEHSPITMLP